MDPIKKLIEEHNLIKDVLSGLEIFTKDLENTKLENKNDIGKFARFFREFADKCHHGKEEDILFKEMQNFGFSVNDGPLAVMYQEHKLGREQVSIMFNLSKYDDWDDEKTEQAISACRLFCQLLSNHIYKEDNILYPMAENRIPEEIIREMHGSFLDFDNNEMGKENIDELFQLAGELTDKYKKST
ncbi:MAG: hypothetical protein GY863_11835 [bacterium]|nr:hypothetical protein [bacterium]